MFLIPGMEPTPAPVAAAPRPVPGATSTPSTPGTVKSTFTGLAVVTFASLPARSLQVTRMLNK